ncbi:MAG: hypothetical protein JNG85_10960 [Spirochaetaceae bacterium]|nr:hypothetical protein [Spirochaetaceae bacterium]
MRDARLPSVILLSCLLGAVAAGLGAQSPSPAGAAAAGPAFRAEGGSYLARGSGSSALESEALERARAAALRALFAGLGKDRLFAEVFLRDPPIGLVFTTESSLKEGALFTANVSLRVDDESLRIVARGPFLAAALALLDEAESATLDAEGFLAAAAEAESAALLGESLGRYGQALDRVSAALALIEALEDGSVLSTAKGRSSPELKRFLKALGDTADKGVARIRAAEAALAKDQAAAAASAVIDAALAEADQAESLLAEERPLVADPSAYGPERLEPLLDRLALQSRALADALAALKRAASSLPDKGYARDKLLFAERRLATAEAGIAAAHRAVDREIRDPAAARAERARRWKWVFLHVPREYLSLRMVPPLGLLLESESRFASTGLFDFRLRSEGSFGESGGVFIRTSLDKRDLPLAGPEADLAPVESTLSQSVDFGVWGRTLVYAGYGWDWRRSLEGAVDPRPGRRIRAGLGGVDDTAGFKRADWLIGLSYNLPLVPERFIVADSLNAGLEALFRLGKIAVLEGEIEHRAHRDPAAPGGLDAVLAWRLAFGLRLPSAFLWGLEYSGGAARPLAADGSGLGEYEARIGRLRLILEYAL